MVPRKIKELVKNLPQKNKNSVSALYWVTEGFF
jgi:hypothetical protein